MLLGFCGLQVAKADSPVTSTDISSYYMEYEMVARMWVHLNWMQPPLHFT